MNTNEIGKVNLRVILGITFSIRVLAKFQEGITNTVCFFDSIRILGFMAHAVADIESVGDIVIILGIGTQNISILIALIMIGAILLQSLQPPFLVMPKWQKMN